MLKLASVGVAVIVVASPAYAQGTSTTCTTKDPRIGEIVAIEGGKRMQINRRENTVVVVVGDPICSNDITAPNTVDVEILFDQPKERVKIPRGSIRNFSDIQPRSLVPAGKRADSDPEAANSLSPMSRAPMVRDVNFDNETGAQGQSAPATTKKPVVGIYLFDDLTGSGQADTFSAMIETAVIASNKFRVIERSQLSKIIAEQGLVNKLGEITANGPVAIEGVDYLIYGSITEVVAKENNVAAMLPQMMGLTSSADCPPLDLSLGADIRITDAKTGEIRFATRDTSSMVVRPGCKDLRVDPLPLMRKSAQRVVNGFVTTIFPIQVAAVQLDGIVVLNFGSGTIEPKEYYDLFRRGASIIDPSNGAVIATEEYKVATIQILEVHSLFSRGQIVEGNLNEIPVGAVVRPALRTEKKPARDR